MPRPLAVVLLLLAVPAMAIAACGSASRKAAGSARPQSLAYVDCMRSHGVPNLPDPGPEGGLRLGPSSGINASAPAFKAAEAQCAKLLPRGGSGGLGGPSSEQTEDRLLALSKCMRAHGVSGFPDPTLGPPPSSPQDFSIAMGTGGVSLLVPKTIDVSSPAFKRAAATCRLGAALGKGQRTLAP